MMQVISLERPSISDLPTAKLAMLDLATKIANLRGVEIIHGESNHGDSKRRLPDLSMNKEIDWVAKTGLDDGLSQLL